MGIRRLDDAATWLDAVTPLLVADETRHNLMFGIADTLVRRPDDYPVAHLWLALDADEPVGAMLQTPPHNLVLGRPASDAALYALVDAAAELGDAVPGVSGVSPEVEAFADRWTERRGEPWAVRMRQGIYECRAANDVPLAPGTPRAAGSDDLAAIVPMVIDFTTEVVPEPIQSRARLESTVRGRIEGDPTAGGFWVWEEDDHIVAISGHGGRTPTGIRVGPVYTPPAERRHGYATSLVAAQTSWLLANAVSACFLYTDLANPTSNAIYRRIGYTQRCEAVDIRFGGR